jgi:hypothetical protein
VETIFGPCQFRDQRRKAGVLPGRTRLIPGESLAYSVPPHRKVVARERRVPAPASLSSLHLARPASAVESDKTDPLDKLQHKMNLVSNYFTK